MGVTAALSEIQMDVHVFYVFFFQAEDGIRDLTVTGVQTCALPISRALPRSATRPGTVIGHLARNVVTEVLQVLQKSYRGIPWGGSGPSHAWPRWSRDRKSVV